MDKLFGILFVMFKRGVHPSKMVLGRWCEMSGKEFVIMRLVS